MNNIANLDNSESKDKALGPLNIIVLILSIYVLVALIIDTFVKLPAEVSELLSIVDNSICVFFLIEFSIRFEQIHLAHLMNFSLFSAWMTMKVCDIQL
jgi:hypothetical protein